jgi:hypothetical protein
MTWFLESPWPSILLGIGLELLLAIYLVHTGRAIAIAAMVLVLAVTTALVLLERWIVTDAEAVEDTLERARSTLEANDGDSLLSLFTADSPRRAEVQSILSRVAVREARIASDMELVFEPPVGPQTATASFTARVEARDLRGQIPYEHMIGRFRVTLRRAPQGWRIVDYAQNDLRAPQGGPVGSPGNRPPRSAR